MFKFVEKTKLWFTIAIIYLTIGVVAWIFMGLNYGIDFKGGTVIDIEIGKTLSDTDIEDIRLIAAKYDDTADVARVEKTQVNIRSSNFTDEQATQLFTDIKTKYQLKDEALLSTDRIGAAIGQESTKHAIFAILIATIGMLIYTTIRFESKFGISAIVALAHDILFTIVVYAVFQIPVNGSFIAGILTILGFSIDDTIVIFDRIRENLKLGKYKDDNELVNASINQSLTRSINTVLTVVICLTSLYIFGVSAIREFALPLLLGIVSGSYSSIFIASPLWLILHKRAKQVKQLKHA
jgi:preprotein translocase subunit SecF